MRARWATVDDVEELLRLRGVMLDAMDRDHDPAQWGPLVGRQLREGLADGRFFAAVVDADPSSGRLAGSGVGMIHERLAGAGDDDGRIGYIQSMATDPAWRRRGVARAVLALLLDAFAERGVGIIGLHATRYGEPLYRSFGFREPSHPELRWRRDWHE